MDAELTALAAAGATALVQSMVGDGWASARERVVGFFTRRRAEGGDGGVVAGELDEAREELVAARDADDADTAADVQAEWRNRMRRALRDDPEAAAELRVLLDELTPDGGEEGRGGVVRNSISGGVQHGNVIQAHTVGDVTLG
ncbi:hypothetical protein [Streptomyces flavofungini]|uniref:CchlP n=1 Tax=Streptomyces flavofungini TaxID=68200 RepID=A0ABS0X350_9ACTN|nr:hypothetical protein [Streptomyces flavofungini]MBJ3807594.1 hypothetical protein [Streptomyces flavofungini]GHC64584.1 hypothetical protein GCM10010349_35810 [Streptomyces flavofungini]